MKEKKAFGLRVKTTADEETCWVLEENDGFIAGKVPGEFGLWKRKRQRQIKKHLGSH